MKWVKNNKEKIIESIKESLKIDFSSGEKSILEKKISEMLGNTDIKVNKIGIKHLKKWSYTGNSIQHESGRFFAIIGLSAEIGSTKWNQPIILQEEIGILGLICSHVEGVLKFLIKLKIEPGNLGLIQLSPTVQATKSNYEGVHGGNFCELIDNFINPPTNSLFLIDNLLSEQNSRFYKKKNRNILMYIDSFTAPNNNEYHWMTLGQIKQICSENNIVNMDLRSIVSGINCFYNGHSYSKYIFSEIARKSPQDIYVDSLSHFNIANIKDHQNWYNKTIAKTKNETKIIRLDSVDNWDYDGFTVSHKMNKHFSVIGCSVRISNREVSSWDQPLIESKSLGIIALMIKKKQSTLELLIQLKTEVGCSNKSELSPTIQTTNSHKKSQDDKLIYDYYKQNQNLVSFSVLQSEEGGRFYHEQNNYSILIGKEKNYFALEQVISASICYRWMELGDVIYLINNSDIVSQQLRSVVAMICIDNL